MAAYYQQGAQEIEQEGLQTLYLMNPGYQGYSDVPATANILLLNSASTAVSLNPPLGFSRAPPSINNQHQFLGIPLQPMASAQDSNHEISSSLQAFTSNPNHSLRSSAVLPHLGFRHQQGLSLSLSPGQKIIPMAFPSATGLSNGVSDLQNFWMESKYLKVAQQLLDEVVNVGNGVKDDQSMKVSASKSHVWSSKEAGIGKEEERGVEAAAEFMTADRQELQMKSVKLVSMLEEVEQRYKQYHNHMQTVVSSFEEAVGVGAARKYTALALQTISKQFRCLRDVISAQVRGISKSLGEEGSLGEDRSSGSRLKPIDHQLRQQRAFQQIGMIQQNAWRPQRGLPGRSVSVLRAWLFEHFLHPYPKDTDKQMLAKQTGLTSSQVSNWFINARVRLWKPMVEEMYQEELKGEEQNNEDDKSSKSNPNGESMPKSNANQDIMPARTDETNQQFPKFALPTSVLLNGDQELMQSNPKRVRSNESNHSSIMQNSINADFGWKGGDGSEPMMKFARGLQGDEEKSHDRSLINRKMSSGDVGLSAYSMGQIDRLDAEQFTPRVMGKSVSLTLGLPHCENISLSRGHQSFLSTESIQLGRRVEMNTSNNEYCELNNEPSVVHPSTTFENMNVQGRKRFASAQLIRDFVV